MPTFNLRNILILGSVSVMFAHIATGVAAWGIGGASLDQLLAFVGGAAGGTACIWLIYLVGRFCLWLRRNQVAGDQYDRS